MSFDPSSRKLKVVDLYEPEFTSWFAGAMMLVLPVTAMLSHLHDPWMPLWSIPVVGVFFGFFYQLTRNALCTVQFSDEGMASSLWGRHSLIRWDSLEAATVYLGKPEQGTKIFLKSKDGKVLKFWDMAGPVARLLEGQLQQRQPALLNYIQQ